MKIVGLPASFYYIGRHRPQEVSPQAQERLRWLRCWQALRQRGLSSSQASSMVGIPRATLYRWLGRLRKGGPRWLEDRSRRPKRRRQPTWSVELAQAVLELREQYPRWGKDKLVILLHREGWQVSTSMVGRILSRLKARGVLREPPRNGVATSKRHRPRPYAIRKPKDYSVSHPGDLVQVDTLDVRPLPGIILKHFTARDVVSRWDALEAHRRATATTAIAFLDTILERMPFPIRALQVDGGSEFGATFEQACRERGVRLFVLPPHSPKLNGCVERAHRTHTEEFYEVYDGALDLATLNQALRDWEQTYNRVRPHQALDSRTPAEYIRECHPEVAQAQQLSHM